MDNVSTELSRKQELFISALLSHSGIIGASKAAGITDQTARRWMLTDTSFQTAYREARKIAFNNALDTLQDVLAESIDTLRTISNDTSAGSSARVRSAQILLEHALAVHKMSELAEKVSELEEALKERPFNTPIMSSNDESSSDE